MHKRIGMLALVLAVLLSLAACRANEAPKIGICLRQTDSGMAAESLYYLDTALHGAGYQVRIMDADMDQSKQNRQVGELLEEEYDLLILEPVMVSAAQELAAAAQQANVPVIFYQQEPEPEVLDSWKKLCYLGADPAQPGSMQGQILLQTPDRGDINGDGTVSYYVIAGPEDHVDTWLRTTEGVTGLTEAGLQTQCLGTQWGDWSRQSGERIAAKAIADFGKDIEVLVCNNDAMAIGALTAIVDGGRTVGRDIYLVGIDGEHHAQVLIRSGEMTGTVAQDLQEQARQITELARKLLAGKAVDKVNYTDYVLLTGENIEDFMNQ